MCMFEGCNYDSGSGDLDKNKTEKQIERFLSANVSQKEITTPQTLKKMSNKRKERHRRRQKNS